MISESLRMQYAGLYLLRMADDQESDFSLALAHDEKVLEPIFEWLYKQGYVEITSDNAYQTSAKGRDILGAFLDRYRDFLENYDVFCAVDLQEGEFAYAYYHDFDDDESWHEFLDQERWDDMRIAVAEKKGFDPIEMVAVSYMNEGLFGESDEGWDYELLLGKVWDEIEKVIASAIKVSELSYSDGNEIINGDDVIEDIIQQGQEVLEQVRQDS